MIRVRERMRERERERELVITVKTLFNKAYTTIFYHHRIVLYFIHYKRHYQVDRVAKMLVSLFFLAKSDENKKW